MAASLSDAAASRGAASAIRLGRYRALLPGIVGLACARCGLAMAVSGGHASTDEGVFTDGASLVAVALLLALALTVFREGRSVSDRAGDMAMRASVSVQALCLVVFWLLTATDSCTFAARFALCALAAAASVLCIGYWLRSARRDGALAATVLVFGGHMVSEVPLMGFAFASQDWGMLAAAAVALGQFACMAAMRANPPSGWMPGETARFDDYFSYARRGIADRRFLVVCAAGIVTLSVVVGFLRGFCDGHPVALTWEARVAYFVLVEFLLGAFLLATLRRRTRAMTVGIWVVMELLAAVALALYAGLHEHLEVGAVPTMALNTLMSAFVCYLVLAFGSVGRRSSLFYMAALWTLWVASSAVGRFALAGFLPIHGDTHITGTVVSLLLLVSTQLVLVKLIDVARYAAAREMEELENAARAGRLLSVGSAGEAAPLGGGDGAASGEGGAEVAAADASAARPSDEALAARHETAPRSGIIERVLGLDGDSSLYEVRRAATQHAVEELGRRYFLSNREVEVLTLYVLGHTQKHLAEELVVSQTTIRTHIKRIYAKTGMHSRQDIIDYLRQYAE